MSTPARSNQVPSNHGKTEGTRQEVVPIIVCIYTCIPFSLIGLDGINAKANQLKGPMMVVSFVRSSETKKIFSDGQGIFHKS
jgi:hypothetical protein